ncbi:MAG: chemotaxis protein CheR, partial [Spirochaetia bacterium]|nr:chemotaxis protein CheR [Spirochaetia bacterium]
MSKIFAILETRTRHDFSGYKTNFILRRLERRLAFHKLTSLSHYAALLNRRPGEADLLLRELSVGVTHFFRDKPAFDSLERKVIPKLVSTGTVRGKIRIWCAGCSTGQEAYSIAILLAERMERHAKKIPITLFATDIDARSIQVARSGTYPAQDLEGISQERRSRFFTSMDGGLRYRIRKT